jgi:ketopantoate reductase
MVLKEMLDITGKQKKRKERTTAVQKIAIKASIATVAAAAGVATGILLAPKSGRETREDLMQGCIHGLSRHTCFACEEKAVGR